MTRISPSFFCLALDDLPAPALSRTPKNVGGSSQSSSSLPRLSFKAAQTSFEAQLAI
jgi:hypothetical protein